jgi:hypothetical protein
MFPLWTVTETNLVRRPGEMAMIVAVARRL